jgi:hypothetical protein
MLRERGMKSPGKVSQVLARAFGMDGIVGCHALTLAEFSRTNKKARSDSHRTGLAFVCYKLFDVE